MSAEVGIDRSAYTSLEARVGCDALHFRIS
jgi:hypothetical protein